MNTWRTVIACAVSLMSLSCGGAVHAADASTVKQPGATGSQDTERAPIYRSSGGTPFGRMPPGVSDRIARDRREIELQRRQRKIEMDALRNVRKADREAWRKRWEEQRQRARQESLEREHRQLRELNERYPDLAAHRKRHAKELERLRQSFEQERRDRWEAFDRLDD